MNELTKKILKAMGLTDAEIATMDGDAPTAVEADITTKIVSHQRTLLENDPEFLKPHRDKAKAEVHAQYEKALKKNGVALTDEDAKKKTPEEKVALLVGKASEGKDSTVQELEQKLLVANQELQKLKDEEIPKIKAEVDAKKHDMDVQAHLTKEIMKLSKDGSDLRNPIDVVQNDLNIEFGSKYKIETDDKGNLIFKDKANGTLIKNADGTKILTAAEIIKGSMVQKKFIAESNATDTPPPVITPKAKTEEGAEGEKNTLMDKGMSKAEAHLQAMKEAKEKAAKTKPATT